MPEVSVVITAFNHDKYIADSINSVLNQTYTDFEIIVINDGSTDNTSNVVREIVSANKDKIRFIDHKINQRPKLSGNEGMSLASGRFIAFNDGDDIWYPTKLEKQMQIFQQDDGKSIGLVYSYGKNMNENPNRVRSDIEAVDVKSDVFTQLFAGAFFFKHSMVIRKEVFKTVGFMDERYPYCCDYELMIRIAAEGFGFDRIPEVLVGHRIHEGNSTINRVVAQLNTKEMLINVSTKYKDLIKSKGIDVQKRLVVCDLQIAQHHFSQGQRVKARKILFDIFLKYPLQILRSKRNIAYIIFSFLPDNLIVKIRKHDVFNKIFKTN